ncbi:MAG: hypothetical protein H0U66_13860 [Gemmatimonadaceae bacterium]|nr:hypothetical protein [Gemmatimonadaceae bacterium]
MIDAQRSPRRLHLVSVWNPSYANDAIDEHLAILLGLARRVDAGEVRADDVYVWWGKVRSQNRQQPQAHVSEMRAIAAELARTEHEEVQLYLTDYRSLYVADVVEIREDVLPESEQGNVPAYYVDQELTCDYWFMLADIRRLVIDDMPAVIQELKKLGNVHYNDRPVSLYGGMVDLPLFVIRPDGRNFFDERERDSLTGGVLWAEHDASIGTGIAAVERELRDNVIGERAWNALERAACTFIATGEQLFREHRADPAFDFGSVIGAFSKALEVQVNAILRTALGRVTKPARSINMDGRTENLLEFRSLMLQELIRVIGGEQQLNGELLALLHNGQWFTGSLPAILDEFREVRNPGTHERRIDRKTATEWRNRLLGIGSTGYFVELAKTRPK